MENWRTEKNRGRCCGTGRDERSDGLSIALVSGGGFAGYQGERLSFEASSIHAVQRPCHDRSLRISVEIWYGIPPRDKESKKGIMSD